MAKLNIDPEGRQLINTDIVEDNGRITSVFLYDDGTEITMIQSADGIEMKSNKNLEIQSDGITVKIN